MLCFFCLFVFFAALPEFLSKPQDVKIGSNGIATFDCVASGNPPPSVFWTKEGSQVLMFPDNSYGNVQVTTQGTLQIRGVQKEDAGYYVCSAISVAGAGTTRAFLQVSTFLIYISKFNHKSLLRSLCTDYQQLLQKTHFTAFSSLSLSRSLLFYIVVYNTIFFNNKYILLDHLQHEKEGSDLKDDGCIYRLVSLN